MRISDGIKDSIVYLCKQSHEGNNYHCGGTGFFVAVQSENPGVAHFYLVTAKHCVENVGSDLYIRINTTDKSFKFIKLEGDWEFSDNPGIDVAVLPWDLPDNEDTVLDYKCLPVEMFATDEIVKEYGIGIGDDIIIAGLFTHRYGTQRNIPIIRSGIIAAAPEEPFKHEITDAPYFGYLVELRSIGGLSGSPVYVYLHWQRKVPTKEGNWKAVVGSNTSFLLGIVHAHWDETQPSDSLDSDQKKLDKVNMGIAIVTPAQDILAILNKEELVKQRRKADREYAKKNAPTLDSAFGDDDHAERFLNLVKGVATTPKSEFDKAEEERKADKP